MSDQWTLCPKCGEEVSKIDSDYDIWMCPNCKSIWDGDELKVTTTEYLREEEDEESNQSRRSKE